MAEKRIGCSGDILGDERVDDPVVLPDYDDPATYGKVIGSRVDIGRLLFTEKRDFLVTNKGKEVKLLDLKGKTIVLFIFPLDPADLWGTDHPDMIDAYNQMLREGPDVGFVLVPVAPDSPVKFPTPPQSPTTFEFPIPSFESPEEFFNHLLSTIPFPAVPFSDDEVCGDLVQETFSHGWLPYWVVIDPNQQVVTTKSVKPDLFKLFGGDELYPLTPQAIGACRHESREQLISNWDKLLGDGVLASDGKKVPVSNLKNKILGLYFCESIQNPLPPPRMELIQSCYRALTSLGRPFEIVQINFHYHFYGAINVGTNPTLEPAREGIRWFTLPFKDPCCRKLQRIFNCASYDVWDGDCLVIVNTAKPDVFEFSGAEMIEAYGAKAYPFARHSLYQTQYDIQQEELTLQSLFPQREPLLPGSLTFDACCLSRKRVLVLLADESIYKSCSKFMKNLEYQYNRKMRGRRSFEVVYVSTDLTESYFSRYRGSMPWLVHPYSVDFASDLAFNVFKVLSWPMIAVAAFDERGKLIAKICNLCSDADREKLSYEFPFVSLDLKAMISWEVDRRCDVSKYYP